jgi:PAS domain S-box-containing protein
MFASNDKTGELFRQLIDSAPDAMIVVDSEGAIVLVNVRAESAFGYARDELIGQPIEIVVPKRYRSAHVGHRRNFMLAPKSRPMGLHLELSGVRKDGSEFPVEISLSPLVTEQGTLISSAIRDISERKRAEAAARLASDRLLSAVESIHGMLALYDAEDRLVMCNSTWRSFFSAATEGPIVGRTHDEIVSSCVEAGLFELGGETSEAFRDRCAAYHRNPVGTLDFRTSEGQSLRLTDRRTLEGGVVSTIWDITDDVEKERELEEARSLAEAASTAKSEFLSSMSHELRTPLNSILGFTELLQRDKKSPLTEAQKGKLDYVLKGGEHLLRLIDEILDLSRIESGRVLVSPEPVGVPEVLAEVKSTLDPMAARAGITLAVEPLPNALPDVIADRTRFAQVLINFGSNAVKYGRRGGRATLTVSMTTPKTVREGTSGQDLPTLPSRRSGSRPHRRNRHRSCYLPASRRAHARQRRFREHPRGGLGILDRTACTRGSRSRFRCQSSRLRVVERRSRRPRGSRLHDRLHRGQSVEHRLHAGARRRAFARQSDLRAHGRGRHRNRARAPPPRRHHGHQSARYERLRCDEEAAGMARNQGHSRRGPQRGCHGRRQEARGAGRL